jgi:hypothetical protein
MTGDNDATIRVHRNVIQNGLHAGVHRVFPTFLEGTPAGLDTQLCVCVCMLERKYHKCMSELKIIKTIKAKTKIVIE